MTDDLLDFMIDGGTAALGIAVLPAWREAVRDNLRATLALGNMLLEFPLPDEAEPAALFRA